MNALHFQGIGGASGDMILAALLDLGASPDGLRAVLQRLPIGPVSIEAAPAGSHGLHGLRLEVRLPESPNPHPTAAGVAHSHGPVAPAHEHRTFRDLREMLVHSDLPAAVRDRSIRVFSRLAEAEGRVHGIPAEDVQFHEVGATDSIVDIAGACWALDALGVERVSFDPLPLGSGTVQCAHGIYPVPAPAVVELLRGLPTAGAGEAGEMVTPTGAALLAEWRTDAECPPGRMIRCGLGFGHRAWPSRPNVLRAMLLETSGSPAPGRDEIVSLETHLDDVTPEIIGALAGRLMTAGAADVTTSPLQMKKQRPGVLLTVLCAPDRRETMLDLLFRESGTFGVRESLMRRTVLPRRMETVSTAYGGVRVKIGNWRGEEVVRKPEFDDCVRLAAAAGVPVKTVWTAALQGKAEATAP